MNGDEEVYVPTPHPWRGIRPWQRHSLVLLVAGTVYIFIGISYIYAELSPAKEASLVLALTWLSMPQWGGVFILAGILAIVSSRWPPVAETWGYMVLTGLSAGWGAFYAMGGIFDETPIDSISAAMAWGLISFMWWGISGLVNPDRAVVVPYGRV